MKTMKKAELYRNEFPLEDLLPEINEMDVQTIVNNCDYTHEANLIALADFPETPQAKVNTADAAVFFQMGYDYAKKQIENKLKPIENEKTN